MVRSSYSTRRCLSLSTATTRRRSIGCGALTADGGEPGPCGWLKDRFGLSWQIVPQRLNELLEDPDPDRARRAMEAMLNMGKIDVAEL